MRILRALILIAPCCGLGLSGCDAADVASTPMVLESIPPGEGSKLQLNEPLTLVFSEPIDPLSVTGDSVALRHAGGDRVAGEWEVQVRQLRFLPRTVLSPTLQDGGFRPGESVRLELKGFPFVSGLRSMAGEPLNESITLELEVAEVQEGSVPFFDETPHLSLPLRFEYLSAPGLHPIREGGPLRLVCAEPLDPSSLDAREFWIDRGVEVIENGTTSIRTTERFSPVTARFVRNDPMGLRSQTEPAAVIELTPTTPLVDEPGVHYTLRFAAEVTVTDFEGNRAWQLPQSTDLLFEVEPPIMDQSNSLRLEFLDRLGYTTTRVPWADGTAHWAHGRVEPRYPAAAGDGSDGELLLQGGGHAKDLQALRIEVPADAEARLTDGPGLRIIRAQGRLHVAGTLSRGSTGRDRDPVPLAETRSLESSGSVTAFLEAAQAQDRDWTVLIAGGDLWLEGRVRVETPLILIAGGRIRIDGTVGYTDHELYSVGEGGGNDPRSTPRPLALRMDSPQGNPLAAPIRYALVTSTLPRWSRERYLWRDLELGVSHGNGQARVRFLGADQPLEESYLVEHPVELPIDQPLRMVLELEIFPEQELGPRAPWDPPVVDFVSLSWDDR